MKLSQEIRDEMIEKMAQKLTDDVDLDSLMDFFYQAQCEYFNDLDDDELSQQYEDLEIEE